MPLKDKKAVAAHARASKLSAQFKAFTAPKRRPADDRLISKHIVCYKANLTYPQIWKLMKAGKFPRSVRLGAKAAWYESEVNAWIENLQRTAFEGDRVRHASAAEVEQFSRRSSLDRNELPPGGWSWHIVVYRIHENLRARIPFIAQCQKIVEASDDEARAIYDLACSKRWKDLAEQAKE